MHSRAYTREVDVLMGGTDWAHGIHKLCCSVARLRLDILRVRIGTIRSDGCGTCRCGRCGGVRHSGHLLPLVVESLQIWTSRMALAITHVRKTATDGETRPIGLCCTELTH